MQNVRFFRLFVVLAAFFFALTAVPFLAMADEVTVTGQLQILDNEAVLQTDSGEYVLEGDNLEQFAGQTVSVTGVLTEIDGDKVIEVKEIKPAQ